MNNILLVVSIIGTFSIMLVVKKFLGKEGLIGWIGIASILANLFLLKSVNILGISATLGNVLFASNFLATDMLTENYNYLEAKKGVKFGIFSVLFFMIATQVALFQIQVISHKTVLNCCLVLCLEFLLQVFQCLQFQIL